MSVLAEIVARKREDVAARMQAVPLANIQAHALPTTRKLGEALRKKGLRFILECKKASPSEGLIRENFDPAKVAATYADFADGISVLTDLPFFQGEFQHLRTVTSIVKQPVLCKDFIVDPYQIVEARSQGADAVLLMMSVLTDAQYRQCAEMATQLNMDALTEVHDEAELERALALDAQIIGINNRDLKTLKIDLSTTERLAPMIPRDKVIVCESGIRSRADIDRMAPLVDAFLVGSRLMHMERLDLAVRELLFGRVKICGLTNPTDVRNAWQKGAYYGGLIFAPASPRCIDLEQAKACTEAAPLAFVGVFVNVELIEVVARACELSLAAVQLHGDEGEEYIQELRCQLPEGCEIWKAIPIFDTTTELPFAANLGVDRILLDTHCDARGGSGISFDWELLANYPDKAHVILAGGLSPKNIDQAHATGAVVLDVNSGVETEPGIKSASLINKLFQTLRDTAAR